MWDVIVSIVDYMYVWYEHREEINVLLAWYRYGHVLHTYLQCDVCFAAFDSNTHNT